MSKVSKKCNEFREKIDNMSGYDGSYIYGRLLEVERMVDDIAKQMKHHDGTIFEDIGGVDVWFNNNIDMTIK